MAAAPGRVNLIAEHIDYSDGFVLPFAIKDRTLVAARKRDDTTVRIASAQRRNKIVTVDIEQVKPGCLFLQQNLVLILIYKKDNLPIQ